MDPQHWVHIQHQSHITFPCILSLDQKKGIQKQAGQELFLGAHTHHILFVPKSHRKIPI